MDFTGFFVAFFVFTFAALLVHTDSTIRAFCRGLAHLGSRAIRLERITHRIAHTFGFLRIFEHTQQMAFTANFSAFTGFPHIFAIVGDTPTADTQR